MFSHHTRVILSFFVMLVLLSGFSFFAAQSVDSSSGLSAAVFQKLLPDDCDEPSDASNPAQCNLNRFLQLIVNVIRWIMIAVFVVAPLLIVYGGIVIMTAAGSTERVSSGKKIITSAVVGIVIALSSFLIIRTIYGFTTQKDLLKSEQFNP